ncbi:MAG: STM4012 family radical SAM protein [Polyangia bacterium]|jgi:oxygen-independent coproporphyrinogen-3 oxidase
MRLAELLRSGGYHSYAYSYPHKTAYRTLPVPIPLKALWATEDRQSLFLYLHVPFCEQRCGFCNLFTQVAPKSDVVSRYLDALERQATVMHSVLHPYRVARLAIGGGTPSYLSAPQLARLFAIAKRLCPDPIPGSIEVSPATIDEEKLAVLQQHHITRISMGVQSLFPSETSGVQRRQDPAHVEHALRILATAAPIRNVDLIYGLPGQTAQSLQESIDRVVELGANELYLYPLYVRPLTILSRHRSQDDFRVQLYRSAKQHLRSLGFRQVSMRMFTQAVPDAEGPDRPQYRCQDDAMIGLGPGARSYTTSLHYATSFAVAQSAIRDRIEAWMSQSADDFSYAHHGFLLSDTERQRRYLILSLLEGSLDRNAYRQRFGHDVLSHTPMLAEAITEGLITESPDTLCLTERGVECADVLGHWLQSDEVLAARAAWEAA